MSHPPGSDTRASPTRASSGPSTRNEARILRTMSYGASVLVIAPPIDRRRPSLSNRSTATPCCASNWFMVWMSARRGTFDSTSRSSVSIPAAISGKAAFLAPPMAISPARGRPPRIRKRSISVTSSAARRRAGPYICRPCRRSWSRRVRSLAGTGTGRSPRARVSWPAEGSCC